MRLVKTYLRNRLAQSSLDSLMLIAIEGPGREHFDFESAVNRWSLMRPRRLDM